MGCFEGSLCDLVTFHQPPALEGLISWYCSGFLWGPSIYLDHSLQPLQHQLLQQGHWVRWEFAVIRLLPCLPDMASILFSL